MASTTAYTGPSAREMFDTHTLSKEIIARANDPEPVLDASELALLKRYVNAPEAKDKANGSGSLVKYIMIQSNAGNDLLSEEEIAELKAWLDKA
ncbi:hypothetical protein IFR04_008402 [Cadophora malorum]|uniref:Uncharacterized protein n=1 Tax=Cadophora malorum TaxID=108018 RepID=A0A8H7TGP9_9HELO|nr:hypothetical protein IFR04_008402 [Cadophora malorum]